MKPWDRVADGDVLRTNRALGMQDLVSGYRFCIILSFFYNVLFNSPLYYEDIVCCMEVIATTPN